MHSADRLWIELATLRDLAAELAAVANPETLAILDRKVAEACAAYREASVWDTMLAASIIARQPSPLGQGMTLEA